MRFARPGSARPPGGARTSATAGAAGVLAALTIGGCGGGGSHRTVSASKAKASPPPVCRPQAAAAIAGKLGVDVASVGRTAGMGSNGAPECRFHAAVAGRRVGVVVNLDSSPQPYARLERAIVEAGQQFGVVRGFTPPVTVPKLGIDASWFPDSHDVMTTDGNALITATVSWAHVSQTRRRALATAAARAYIGKLNKKELKGEV